VIVRGTVTGAAVAHLHVLFAVRATSATVLVHGRAVPAVDVDEETRCAHYGIERDIVAIRVSLLRYLLPLSPVSRRGRRPRRPAVAHRPPRGAGGGVWRLRAEVAIQEYLGVTGCPACETRFNPGCADHYGRYVETTAHAGEDA